MLDANDPQTDIQQALDTQREVINRFPLRQHWALLDVPGRSAESAAPNSRGFPSEGRLKKLLLGFCFFREAWETRKRFIAKRGDQFSRISQELLDELTDRGTRDLTKMRLSQMENEVYQLADRFSERLLSGMLEDRAGQADQERCPCCQSPLEVRPPERESIQMKRCQVEWDKPVKRCPKCCRDFVSSSVDDETLV